MDEKKLAEYKFPNASGEFIGVLKYRKKLENKPCLLCYFLSEDNEKIVLPVWENSTTKRYSPVCSSACFLNDICENTKWICKYEVSISANGKTKTKFMSAFMMHNSEESNMFFAEKFYFLLIKKAFPRCFVADLVIEKISFSDDIFFKCKDKNSNYYYEISNDSSRNWKIKRTKLNDTKERDTVISIDNISFDIVSKKYI